MQEVIIDGVKFVPEKNNKQDIREYCKEHRVWAVKSKQGYVFTIDKEHHPQIVEDKSGWAFLPSTAWGRGKTFFYPDVPWDKSLIAPDGSMPLWEKDKANNAEEWGRIFESAKTRPIPRATHFEVGKWYLNVGENEDCLIEEWPIKKTLLDGKPHKCTRIGIDSAEFEGLGGLWIWHPSDWIEVDAPKEEKKKPHRGDPIFVWESFWSKDLPCPVYYFHSIDSNTGRVYIFQGNAYGAKWPTPYAHYRLFDASLVGVPRKDWNK